MYIVCLIFALMALVGCILVTTLFLKNDKYTEQDVLDLARQFGRLKERDNDQTAT